MSIIYQVTLEDIVREKYVSLQPERTAFIDESGSYGFDFSKENTLDHYVVCAVVVKNNQIKTLEDAVNKISHDYFGSQELKSNAIGNNIKLRMKICAELLVLDFSLIVLIADKKAFYKDSPLTNCRDAFVKFLHQRLYDTMYSVYPKLKIVEDEYGTTEFQKSYRNYVIKNRPQINLLNEYDFDYVDSKYSPIIQIADVVAGSIMQHLRDNNSRNFQKLFQSKIRGIINFPNVSYPYSNGENIDGDFEKNIYDLADHCAMQYIDSHRGIVEEEIRLRVLFLEHLLFVVRDINPKKFISSFELTKTLTELSDFKISRDYLYRKIIAPLRDSRVIIASSLQGFKIPTCVKDIISYVNLTSSKVGPMLDRVGICRELILKQTDGEFDVFDDLNFTKYKRFFDGE